MTIWCLVPRTAISDIAKWRTENSRILPAGSFWTNIAELIMASLDRYSVFDDPKDNYSTQQINKFGIFWLSSVLAEILKSELT